MVRAETGEKRLVNVPEQSNPMHAGKQAGSRD